MGEHVPGTTCVIRAASAQHNKCVREGYELVDAAPNSQDVLVEDPDRNHAPKELTGKTAGRVLARRVLVHFVHRGRYGENMPYSHLKCDRWACWCNCVVIDFPLRAVKLKQCVHTANMSIKC